MLCLLALDISLLVFREELTTVCFCGKLEIKQAPASGERTGLSKGQFVSFNYRLSASRTESNSAYLFAFSRINTVLVESRVDVITLGHGLVQKIVKALERSRCSST